VIYVIRKKDKSAASTPATPDAAPATPPAPGTDPLAPQSNAQPQARKSNLLMQDGVAPEGNTVTVDGKVVVVTPPPAATNPDVVIPEVVPPVVIGPGPATAPIVNDTTGIAPGGEIQTTDSPQPKFEFNSIKEPDDRVVIRIPYTLLKSGQLKYNVIIKPGDLIFVPSPTVGEYYMGGNVQAPGAYSLTARKITIMQALVAARGLNEVAWPSRTEIVRRLPGDKQVFVRVDLDKIAAGQEPDLYLKADDRVNVGTNAIAPFLAILRNGFRLTYGFGFLYDKNFANDDNNNNNNN